MAQRNKKVAGNKQKWQMVGERAAEHGEAAVTMVVGKTNNTKCGRRASIFLR